MSKLQPTVLMLSQEVHPIPPLKGAAVEQWIDAVAQRMKTYRPVLVSPPHPLRPLRETVGGVAYERVAMGTLYKRLFRKITRLDPWPYIQRVVQRARPYAPTVLHIHNAPGFVKPLHKAFPEATLILHMHNEKALPPDLPVDCLVGCSDYICRWFAEQVQWERQPQFHRVRNGVNLEQFVPRWDLAPALLAERRVQYGIPTDKINLLYVGRISPEKGPDTLVEAFRELDPARFHLTLVGEWPEGDPQRNGRVLFARALQEKLAGLPITVLGCLSPDQVSLIYPLGDLMVIPSRFEEPFSMVAIEAMASGVPLMALRRGGMVEYLRDGENACLLPASTTASELASAIRAASQSGEQLLNQARVAQALVAREYTWDTVVSETEALFEALRGGAVRS